MRIAKSADIRGDPTPVSAANPRELRKQYDAIVIGAGVIGLSIGWRLARGGSSVAVIERDTVGCGASLAATGMLAAAAEFEPGGQPLVPLALESQRLWPSFRKTLEADAGEPIDYREEGTLLIALGREEVERLRFRHELQQRAGVQSAWLSGPEIRDMEPGLRSSVISGIFCPDDHQVDPAAMMSALRAAFIAAGGTLIENCPVEGLELAGGRIAGVTTPLGAFSSGTVIMATGATMVRDGLLPQSVKVPMRPLKGQSLALRLTREAELGHVVWTETLHMAPKSDGRLIVGATVEERGFDDTVTAGGVYALLEGARRAFPAVEEMALEAVWTGWRPTTDDDAPILGATPIEGLVVATGHHRNGYLLAPATAHAVEALVTDGEMPHVARDFGLDRFARNARQGVPA